MTDDLERRLEVLGRADAPELSSARLDAIEARIMQNAADVTPSRRRAPLVLAAAAAIVLLIAGLVFAAGGGADEARLEFADGVTLERPDEPAAVGVAGDELPDGTIIEVGPGGAAIVDDDRYGPGRYIVVDGEVRSIRGTADSTTTTTPGATNGVTTTHAVGVADTSIVSSTTRPRDVTSTSVAADRATTPTDGRPVPSTTQPSDRGRPSTTDRTTTVTTTATTGPRDRPTTTVTDSRPRRTTTSTDATTTTTVTDSRPRRTTTTTIGRDRDRRP